MIRIKILFAIMSLAVMPVTAADQCSMVIETMNGENMTIDLSSELQTTFSEGNMNIHSQYVDLTIPLSNIKGWRYTGLATDHVENVISDDVRVIYDGDRIVVSGLAPDTEVMLFSLGGQLLRNDRSSGEYSLTLSDLDNGLYILTVNNRSLKIFVKR